MGTYRLGIKREELIIRLIHGGEVGHLCNVDVDFDDVAEGASGRLEDGGEVLEGLAGAVFDCALGLDHAWLVGEDADVAGAVDHAVVFYGLGELGEGRWGGGCEDFFDLVGHFGGLWLWW